MTVTAQWWDEEQRRQAARGKKWGQLLREARGLCNARDTAAFCGVGTDRYLAWEASGDFPKGNELNRLYKRFHKLRPHDAQLKTETAAHYARQANNNPAALVHQPFEAILPPPLQPKPSKSDGPPFAVAVMAFHVALRACREAEKMTVAELADAVDVAETTVRKWESGIDTPMPCALRGIATVVPTSRRRTEAQCQGRREEWAASGMRPQKAQQEESTTMAENDKMRAAFRCSTLATRVGTAKNAALVIELLETMKAASLPVDDVVKALREAQGDASLWLGDQSAT